MATAQSDFVRFDTNLGSFDVELYHDAAPKTVLNFLFYVGNETYTDSIVHRSVRGFVVQGGGYDTTGTPLTVTDPVINEPGISNLRGTIAMAKLSGLPNSATNQWFINLADNTELDSNNGGFTVFGKVMGDGMDVVDLIASQTIVDLYPDNPNDPFGELPVFDSNGDGSLNQPVIVRSIVVMPTSVPEPATATVLMMAAGAFGLRRRRRR